MTRQGKKPRRQFGQKDTIRTLLHQGVEIRCFRTKEPVTLDNVHLVEKEHLHERELGGPDEPGNCRFSLKAAHKIVTNGTKATSAGSSKHRIAKAKRIGQEDKFVVVKSEPKFPAWLKQSVENAERSAAPKPKRTWQHTGIPKRSWPSRKMQSRKFEKRRAS